VQEIYLDYEDFESPLKNRQRRVYGSKVAFDFNLQTFYGWDKYLYVQV
jgi:hypothetical protein